MTPRNRSARPEAASTRWFGAAGAVLLAAVHFSLAISGARFASSTFDEGLHVTAGMANVLAGDHRLHSGNGLLPQVWAALPLALSDGAFAFPNPDSIIDQQPVDDFHLLTHFLGHVFFYEVGNDPAEILAAARAQIALAGAALCLIVFGWARALWGTAPALLACGLASLSPNLLAHAGLATSDLLFTTLLLLALGLVWQSFWQRTVGRILLAGLSLGALALTKVSAIAAAPMVGLLLLGRAVAQTPLRWWARPPVSSRSGRAAALLGIVVLQGLTAGLLIWAAYGFRYEVLAEDQPGRAGMAAQWAWVHEREGASFDAIDTARAWRVLPEGFLFSAAFVLRHAEERNSFFLGDSHIGGDWRFFPFAVAVKTPIALFPLLGIAGWLLARAPREERRRLAIRSAPLWILFLVYGAVAVSSSINLGLRHVLPLYPPLFILAGGAAWHLASAGALRRATVGLLGLSFAAASFAARPHYLAYFNATVSPENGYRVLVDSSLDWGQDLEGLAQYLRKNPQLSEKKVYLSYFGSADPMFHDLDVQLLPGFFDWPTVQHREADAPLDWTLEPGLYAISATMLQQAWSGIPRHWGPAEATTYRRLRARFQPLERTDDPAASLRGALQDPATRQDWLTYRDLRLARLCEVLRQREPDGSIGHSILLYDVGRAELAQVARDSATPHVD